MMIIMIVTRFETPAFFYGQRLRRNAGRGQVEEVIELIIRGCSPSTIYYSIDPIMVKV